ncbi:hypothetical protein NJ76_27175 [Rhodococcus sp. IITR03]|nr:hypothetical protein NJ76_27175 [Rhodococcus sp. IITR03]
MLAGGLLDALREFLTDREGERLTDGGLAGGTRTIRGQGENLRDTGEFVGPVVELTRQLALGIVLGAEDALLPQRVVGVLDLERFPAGVSPAACAR